MDEPTSKLTDVAKKNLKDLYEKFIESLNESDKSENQSPTLDAWKIYSEKIKNGLSLDEHTSTLEISNQKDEKLRLPGGYLCNFLERESKEFGSSRPGSSHQYMVHINAKDDRSKGIEKGKYYINKKETKNGEEKSASPEQAKEVYKSWIMPLLKKLVTAKGINEVKEIEESDDYKKYEAEQILRKIVVLESINNNNYDFIFVYKKEVIDDLYSFFFKNENKEQSYLEKNNAIAIAAKDILLGKEKEIDLNDWKKLSGFLWEFANTKSLATEESPNVILYGPPGTGKTYTVKKSINFLTHNDSNLSTFVQFHPSFTYEDFIDGLKPIGVSSNGNMQFEFVNGVFKEFCINAKEAMKNAIKNKKEIPVYYFVVDEINRANLSAVFGETLSLIEADYRDSEEDIEKRKEGKETGATKDENNNIGCEHLITTQNCKILETMINNAEKNTDKEKLEKLAYYYDEKAKEGKKVKFGIPSNIRFIGMMNDVDKSIDSFDLALRRRFKWEQMKCDYDVLEDYFVKSDKDEIEKYVESCKNLNEYISKKLGLGSSYEFGHSFFMKLPKDKKISDAAKTRLYENYLEPTLREYLRAFFDESEIEGNLKEAKKQFLEKDADTITDTNES